MANEKRYTVLLDPKSHLRITVMSPGPGENTLYLKFNQSGVPESIQNYLAAIIRVRLEINDIPSTYKAGQHYFTIRSSNSFITEKNNAHVMCDHARDVMEEIGSLCQNGLSLQNAAQKTYEADLRILRHMKLEQAQEQMDNEQDAVNHHLSNPLRKREAREAIMHVVERIMPRKEALAFAENFSSLLVKNHPTRPAVDAKNEREQIEYRGTEAHDALFRLVKDACDAGMIPDTHKRKYAIGEIFDALHAAYTSQNQPTGRQRYVG